MADIKKFLDQEGVSTLWSRVAAKLAEEKADKDELAEDIAENAAEIVKINATLAAALENEGEGLDSIKELAAWIEAHGTEAAGYSAAISALEALVGDTAVATQIANAIAAENLAQYATDADLEVVANKVDTQGTVTEAVGVALDLKADRNELLQNKEEITNQESYELQFKLRLPSVKEYVYTGDNTSGVSPTGSMCSKFSGIEQAMGVPAAYSSTAPNALAELIGGCTTACSDTPDSMIYSNILPRITLNFPNLVAAGAWRNRITLTTYDISGYSRTSGDKTTFTIKYDSETDEYTLRRSNPRGVLVFNSQNVVLLNQMSKFDDTLTDPNRSPSAAVVGEALSNNIETITTHTSNEAIHVTAEEKEAWNSAAATVSNLNQGLVLTDTVTGTNYRVTVAEGKVTLVEVSE